MLYKSLALNLLEQENFPCPWQVALINFNALRCQIDQFKKIITILNWWVEYVSYKIKVLLSVATLIREKDEVSAKFSVYRNSVPFTWVTTGNYQPRKESVKGRHQSFELGIWITGTIQYFIHMGRLEDQSPHTVVGDEREVEMFLNEK